MPILRSCVGRRRREPKNHSALKVGVKNICLAAAGAESFFGPLYLCAPDVKCNRPGTGRRPAGWGSAALTRAMPARVRVSPMVSHILRNNPLSYPLYGCSAPQSPEGRRGRDRRKRHEYQDLR